MSDGEGPGGPPLITTRTMDIVVALLMLAAAAVVISDSLRLGMGWQENEGPRAGYFPFYIGLILAVSSAVNLVRAVLDRKDGAKTFTTKPALIQVLAVLIPLAIYVGAVAVIGIYVASIAYMALFMWHFGKYALWRGLLIGFAVSAVFFLMFEIWFLVPLPKGPLDEPLVPIVTAFMKSIGL
ncbi:MAG: tripartite tricarboxylate transporter TctB family protein [Alphaproteobacteria bacterium]